MKVALMLAAAITLVGCARVSADGRRPATEAEVELVRAGMVELLKDPDSALFRDVTIREDHGTVCGKVNAKNGLGGYAGYTAFAGFYRPALDGVEPQISVLAVDQPGQETAANTCARADF